jgi:hypothetical protein
LPTAKKVILSRRGKLERHAGVLQASVHGQIEPGEISQIAMKREFEEELKGDFHQLTNVIDLGDAVVGQLHKEHTYYHGAILPDEFFDELQTTQEVSEILLIEESEVSGITPYSKVKEEEGYDFVANKVMFDDEIDVLKKVFKEFA